MRVSQHDVRATTTAPDAVRQPYGLECTPESIALSTDSLGSGSTAEATVLREPPQFAPCEQDADQRNHCAA